MHICPLSWALRICRNIGIWTYFGSVTVESVKFFRHFAFWRHGTRLAIFFIADKNCIFLAHLLRPLKIWQLWFLRSYKVFMDSPYTIVTPYDSFFKIRSQLKKVRQPTWGSNANTPVSKQLSAKLTLAFI